MFFNVIKKKKKGHPPDPRINVFLRLNLQFFIFLGCEEATLFFFSLYILLFKIEETTPYRMAINFFFSL